LKIAILAGWPAVASAPAALAQNPVIRSARMIDGIWAIIVKDGNVIGDHRGRHH